MRACLGLCPPLFPPFPASRQFTGADTRQIGRFEVAHGSTHCLDEIGELPLELQAKLLRSETRWRIKGKDGSAAILGIHLSTLERGCISSGSSGRGHKNQIRLSTSLQRFPQYVEAPPNIEAKRIISYVSAVLSYSSNSQILKDESKLLLVLRLLADLLLLYVHDPRNPKNERPS